MERARAENAGGITVRIAHNMRSAPAGRASASRDLRICSCVVGACVNLPLLLVVFLSALLWGAMVLRYQSIWPAWLSHCVLDFISDSIFQV
jgi:membrane protease YdiL (CAAX protease family)